MAKMRVLDLLFAAVVMIGGTLWLAFVMTAPDQRRSQAAIPYVGPDISGTAAQIESRNG